MIRLRLRRHSSVALPLRGLSRGFLPWRFADAGPGARSTSFMGPASANLHNNGLMQAQETANPRPTAAGRGKEFGQVGDMMD
jgi:hypothetical protein